MSIDNADAGRHSDTRRRELRREVPTKPFGILCPVQPPEEPTDDVSVRIDWPVQDEGLEPADRANRRGRLSGSSSRPIASATPHGGSSDLLPARIGTGRRGRSGDRPSTGLGADEGARGKSDAAVERLASGVDRLATMVQKLDDRLAAQVEPSLPAEVVRRLDALLGEASGLRGMQERLVALTQTRAKQESELLTSINHLAEDLKAVRKQIPISKRAGGQVEAGTVERIADAVRRAMEQPAPKRAVAKRGATTAKVTPGRRPRAKSTAKSSDAATATRRSKRAS
jgi:hypothetical protein